MSYDYAEHIALVFRGIAARLENCVFSGDCPKRELPWPAVIGEKCPYCHGYGHDDGGPGSWWCDECNGTGVYGAHYGERPIIVPEAK